MKPYQKNLLLASVLILLAAGMRVLNAETHFYHLAPVAAIALFSGSVIRRKGIALLLPLVATLLADLYFQFFTEISGFYGLSQILTYGSLALIVLLGSQLKKRTPLRIAGFTIAGSVVFFLLSNFGVWLDQLLIAPGLRMYPMSFAGLGQCYLMALPFYTPMGTTMFVNSFAGDLLFSGLLFGTYALAKAKGAVHPAFENK